MEDVRLAKGEDLDELKEMSTDHIANENIHVTAEQKASWDNKANADVYAKVGQAGLVKPYSQNGVNRSGLVFYDDGSVVVNALSLYGLTRSGDGKVMVSAATESEISDKAQSYKPIVPSNLQYAVETIVGSFAGLKTADKTNLINAINELVARITALENK